MEPGTLNCCFGSSHSQFGQTVVALNACSPWAAWPPLLEPARVPGPILPELQGHWLPVIALFLSS